MSGNNGVILDFLDMYMYEPADRRQIMSEIEMANLRSTNQTPEYDVPYAGEVPSAQDRLLTGNHVRNGNGSPAFSPEFYQQYKQNVYEIGMHRPQPAGHGSGMVFRQRKRPCWCVLLVIVAVALMAAGISLGVLFGVVKKAEMTDSELAGQAGDASRNTSQPTVVVLKNSSVTTQASPTRTQAPPQTPTPSPDASPTSGKDFIPGSRWGVNVRRFKAFWHPGDSRVLEVLLSNGTKLLAAGHKANDGTLRGLYSLSLIDGQRRTTRVRFMGPHNLASIILPDGTIVNLDWSSNNQDVECKVFQIPPPVTSLGGAAARELNRPTSHLATLQLGVHSYLLRQVSRIINEAATDPGGVVEDEPMNPASRRLCTPRLPVKVTKCGGQYPYDGAFVQGDVTLQNGATLPMAALPWRRDDDDDECYKGVREAAPNFYIPLPGYIDQTTSREIAGRFLHSASRWWGKVCEVVGSVLEVDIERHEVCANMAVSAQTQLSHNSLYRVVYDSCTALLASLNTACRALDEVSLWAAGSTGFNHEGGMDTNRASSGTGGATGDASRQLPAQSILQHALANATSLQEPSTSRAQNVDVKTYAFCPSTQPLTSFEKSVLLTTPDGGGNVTTHEADMVHVNCMGHPEVTYFYLGHAAAADTVKHRLQVCAVCAFEKTISVHVMRDLMCCNDTCTREARCEETTSDLGEGLKESHTFGEQNSVYCHEFLTAADSPLPGLPGDCRGTCQSSLQVRFQVKDAETVGVGGRVYLDQVLACHEGYRSTCKSTFGH